MEVHHHSHTARKKWTHYFWEFLMLFLAVFCGFMAENIREHKIEQHRAHDFAKSLVKDLQSDISSLNIHQKTSEKYIVLTDSLLEGSKKNLEGRNATEFSFYTRFIYWTGPISWNRSTFEQIKNSGSLRYFKNYQLLEKIMKYEAVVNETEGEYINHMTRGNMLLNLINQIIDPAFHHDLSTYRLTSFDSIPVNTRENFLTANVESLEKKREKIREMLNMAIVQQRNLRFSIDTRLVPAKDLANELISELKKEYHLE